jgi:adenylate cyclase
MKDQSSTGLALPGTVRVNLPVDIRLLGHFELSDPAGGLIAISGERQRALLAMLAVETPRPVSVDRLVEELWGEAPIDAPEAALQVAISRLRKTIGASAVVTVPGGYRIDVRSGSIDVDRFRAHTRRGRQLLILGHPGQAAEAFRQALAQWRGRVLEDLDRFDFATAAARRLEEERLDVVEWLMDAMLQTGGHQLVVGDLAGLAESHPTRERLWYQLMIALYRSGRQAEALKAYSRLSSMLGRELGIAPSPEIADLEERILLHDPALSDPGSTIPAVHGDSPDPELVSFKPGELIVEEGMPARSVYWIEHGEVEVYRRTPEGDQVLALLGRGRYFGELASLLGTGRTASVRAVTATTLSIHTVSGFRHRLGVEQIRAAHPDRPVDLLVDLVGRGDYLSAYDEASSMIETGETSPHVRYLAVLALAKAGATALARRRYTALGLDSEDPATISSRLAEDIAALLPRLDKDLALASAGEESIGWASRSAAGYESAYRRLASSYLGTNAATLWLLAGEAERSRSLAETVLASGIEEDGSYWSAVTEAECALLLGRIDQASSALERAGGASDSDHAARATTLKQLRLVCRMQGIDESILRPVKNPTVIHYTGHRISSAVGGRFPAAEESRVAEDLRQRLASLGVGIGFGSLAAGADILAAEALLGLGAELHVVLPFERDEFVRVSVAPAGEQWVERFERCLAAASRVVTAIRGEYLDDPVLFDFCARIAMGDALVRAGVLETDVVQVAVWDGDHRGGDAGTEVDVARWRATGNQCIVIPVGNGSPAPLSAADRSKRQIRGLVFADVAGFSILSDAQVLAFQDLVMAAMGKVVARYETNLLAGRTWGDGVYLVFDDICAAAECALELQGTLAGLDLERAGLDSLRGMRVAAHAAPVFDGWDPIGGNRLFYGSGVTHAARIEPRTPEGEVYVTHPFAALAVLEGERGFECKYVGTIQAAKGYGPVSLYSLHASAGGEAVRTVTER